MGDNAPLRLVRRLLIAAFLIGILVGGISVLGRFGEVEHAIKEHDRWAIVFFPITEGLAWLSTPFMLGAAARRLGLKKIAFKQIPDKMRDLHGDRAFRWSMRANMIGAGGTAGGLILGGISLPGSTQLLAYGVAAGSLAISSIPFEVAYRVDRYQTSRREAAV